MSAHPLSRWLRSRQLLMDSGFGVSKPDSYPSFGIERISSDIFSLSVIMPPCSDEQLTINLDRFDLTITAFAKDDQQQLICEHRFKLSAACTIAGANWDRDALLIELICQSKNIDKTPNQLVSFYRGSGSWLLQKQGQKQDEAA